MHDLLAGELIQRHSTSRPHLPRSSASRQWRHSLLAPQHHAGDLRGIGKVADPATPHLTPALTAAPESRHLSFSATSLVFTEAHLPASCAS
jgi:hypothetical protein